MAHCPNCGSEHIQLKRETDVNWGRAAAGWALFGVVGGAVGAVTGEDRNANACLNCGTSWKAADLYKTLQIIKSLTGEQLDLVEEEDRLYMNSFMSEVGPYLESVSAVEKKAEKLVADIQNKSNEQAAAGCSFGCLMAIGGCTTAASVDGGAGVLLALLLFPLIGWGIGALLDKSNKKYLEQKLEKAKREAKTMNSETKKNLQLKVKDFMKNYS